VFDWNHQAPHIDKTDFLNGVIREKKRFENSLDDSVALGLNTGTELLMNQVYLKVVSFSYCSFCFRWNTSLLLSPKQENIILLKIFL